MITVVNSRHHDSTPRDVYCGRGSPLGNPFRISETCSREEAISLYRDRTRRRIEEGDAEIRGELNRIWRLAKKGDVNLVCFCAPRACHADFIKQLIEEKL